MKCSLREIVSPGCIGFWDVLRQRSAEFSGPGRKRIFRGSAPELKDWFGRTPGQIQAVVSI
jgi:hypothetical protein